METHRGEGDFNPLANPEMGWSFVAFQACLQLAATLARVGRRAVYFSGEEAAAQVRLRAARLGLSDAPVALACETSLAHILATLEARKATGLAAEVRAYLTEKLGAGKAGDAGHAADGASTPPANGGSGAEKSSAEKSGGDKSGEGK